MVQAKAMERERLERAKRAKERMERMPKRARERREKDRRREGFSFYVSIFWILNPKPYAPKP